MSQMRGYSYPMARVSWGTSGDAGKGTEMGLVIGLIVWALFMTAGYFVGKHKGRPGVGIILAALLGLAGIIIMACLPAKPAKDVAVQRQYDLQQAEVSGRRPPPSDLYAPSQFPGEPG
jgi:hypothetical protein